MVQARCKYFGECGGCSSQDVDYSEQLNSKVAGLAAVLALGQGEEVLISAHSGEQYGYRNRIDLVMSESGPAFKFKGKWWKNVEIERCEIAEERINQLITEFRQAFPKPDYFHLREKTGTLKHLVIRVSRHESSLSFVVNFASPVLAEFRDQLAGFAQSSSAHHLLLTRISPNTNVSVGEDYEVLKGGDFICEELLGKTFYYHLQGFFQTNTVMAEKMHSYVRAIAGTYPSSAMQLLDLYGGVGTFGIINADLFSDVVVVENGGPSIEAAGRNAQINSVTNLRAIALDAKELKTVPLTRPLFVITDPPRIGMDERAVARLLELQPEAIVYISCNVKQLALDLPKLAGYRVKSAALFDLFPHTPHSEAVIELIPA